MMSHATLVLTEHEATVLLETAKRLLERGGGVERKVWDKIVRTLEAQQGKEQK